MVERGTTRERRARARIRTRSCEQRVGAVLQRGWLAGRDWCRDGLAPVAHTTMVGGRAVCSRRFPRPFSESRVPTSRGCTRDFLRYVPRVLRCGFDWPQARAVTAWRACTQPSGVPKIPAIQHVPIFDRCRVADVEGAQPASHQSKVAAGHGTRLGATAERICT